MTYTSNEDYKAKHKNRGEWDKANDYEVFGWNICMECQFYKPDPNLLIHGECHLMGKSGCYDGVMYDAVCNRYINKRGYDINGKVVEPSKLPKWVKTKKKGNEIFIVA